MEQFKQFNKMNNLNYVPDQIISDALITTFVESDETSFDPYYIKRTRLSINGVGFEIEDEQLVNPNQDSTIYITDNEEDDQSPEQDPTIHVIPYDQTFHSTQNILVMYDVINGEKIKRYQTDEELTIIIGENIIPPNNTIIPKPHPITTKLGEILELSKMFLAARSFPMEVFHPFVMEVYSGKLTKHPYGQTVNNNPYFETTTIELLDSNGELYVATVIKKFIAKKFINNVELITYTEELIFEEGIKHLNLIGKKIAFLDLDTMEWIRFDYSPDTETTIVETLKSVDIGSSSIVMTGYGTALAGGGEDAFEFSNGSALVFDIFFYDVNYNRLAFDYNVASGVGDPQYVVVNGTPNTIKYVMTVEKLSGKSKLTEVHLSSTIVNFDIPSNIVINISIVGQIRSSDNKVTILETEVEEPYSTDLCIYATIPEGTDFTFTFFDINMDEILMPGVPVYRGNFKYTVDKIGLNDVVYYIYVQTATESELYKFNAVVNQSHILLNEIVPITHIKTVTLLSGDYKTTPYVSKWEPYYECDVSKLFKTTKVKPYSYVNPEMNLTTIYGVVPGYSSFPEEAILRGNNEMDLILPDDMYMNFNCPNRKDYVEPYWDKYATVLGVNGTTLVITAKLDVNSGTNRQYSMVATLYVDGVQEATGNAISLLIADSSIDDFELYITLTNELSASTGKWVLTIASTHTPDIYLFNQTEFAPLIHDVLEFDYYEYTTYTEVPPIFVDEFGNPVDEFGNPIPIVYTETTTSSYRRVYPTYSVYQKTIDHPREMITVASDIATYNSGETGRAIIKSNTVTDTTDNLRIMRPLDGEIVGETPNLILTSGLFDTSMIIDTDLIRFGTFLTYYSSATAMLNFTINDVVISPAILVGKYIQIRAEVKYVSISGEIQLAISLIGITSTGETILLEDYLMTTVSGNLFVPALTDEPTQTVEYMNMKHKPRI